VALAVDSGTCIGSGSGALTAAVPPRGERPASQEITTTVARSTTPTATARTRRFEPAAVLDAAGNPVSSLGSFTSLMSGPIACNASPRDVAEKEMAAADGGPLRYDPEAGQFVFSWRTSREWAGCRLLRLTLADGSRTFAMFRLR